MSNIEWRHNGRQLIIPAHVLAPSPSMDLIGVRIDALIDTGSTTSGIMPDLARHLNLHRRGKRPMGSAGGEIQAERFLFRIGLMADGGLEQQSAIPFVFDEIIGFELRNTFKFQALIRMDILSQCDMTLDRGGRSRLTFGR